MHRKHLRQSRSKPHSWQAWTTGMVFERQPGDLTASRNLRILNVGPKEKPFGSGYTTSIRRWAMSQTELASANRVGDMAHLRIEVV